MYNDEMRGWDWEIVLERACCVRDLSVYWLSKLPGSCMSLQQTWHVRMVNDKRFLRTGS